MQSQASYGAQSQTQAMRKSSAERVKEKMGKTLK